MSIDNIKSYLNNIHTLEDRTYIFTLIAYNAAPTIAKLKPSSLMVFRKDDKKNSYCIWERYKEEIRKYFQIDFYELKKTECGVHILFYNKFKLNSILKDERNINFLRRFGYSKSMALDEFLRLLSKRYERVCPHEIGIFLGYPISDVVDFIECPNKDCLMRGYWKVYNDVESAKVLFDSYDKAKIKVMSPIIKKVEKATV